MKWQRFSLVWLAVWAGGVVAAQPSVRVFMITDAEGVAGICRQEQTDPTNGELQRLLTGEIHAAVEGFLAGGATEVVVWDGHETSRTLSVETIHPKAKLVMGGLGPSMLMERGFAALAFVGQHARANRPAGVMAHSYSSLGIQKITMNGKEVGEVETRAALAGWFGVPVIFLSGDKAAAEDLRAIVPEAVTAEVKEGLGYYACLSLTAAEARALIRKQAEAAMRKLSAIKPYRVEGPVTLEVELTTRSTPPPGRVLPEGVQLAAPRTIRYEGSNFWEAWTKWQGR